MTSATHASSNRNLLTGSLQEPLFILTMFWAALLPWLSNHPPMIDLPQHAAQIALWRDLLTGKSAWEEYFRINLFTPYLLGYGLALPLSLLIGITAALKLMLSVAYVAFVLLCRKIRSRFNADPRLDWLFLITFFGYAYKWGFFTFLVAAPIGLLFILLAEEYARAPSRAQSLKLVVTGLVLLASHGLVFLFAVGAGFGMHLVRNYRLRNVLSSSWPFIALIVVCGVYFVVNKKFNSDMPTNLSSAIQWNYGPIRFAKALLYTVAPFSAPASMLIPAAVVVITLAAPWLLGLKINRRNLLTLVPFALTAFILVFVPNYAFSTGLLYQRFALFLLPAYAWMFLAPAQGTPGSGRRSWVVILLMVATWSLLTLHTARTLNFSKETAGIDNVISRLEPDQRALMLIFDPQSEADGRFKIYVHYPAWYQAEKGGLVDFNFAWFPPQIVRYRPDHLPTVAPGFEWNADTFSWPRHRGDSYRYFFIRHTAALPASLFAGAACQPALLVREGYWSIYENRGCR